MLLVVIAKQYKQWLDLTRENVLSVAAYVRDICQHIRDVPSLKPSM